MYQKKNSFTGRMYLLLVVSGLVACFAGSLFATEVRVTTTETFETGTNVGAWTWGTGTEEFAVTDGIHGRYLRETHLVTFTPRASTSFGDQSIFVGDYRGRNVASVGIDMAIASVDGNVANRKVTLILLNDNGTPDNLEDDWGAYTVTNLPVPPTGVIGLTDLLQWASYDIPVPSQSAALPDGWSWISRGYQRRNGSWARLMRDVDHVGFVMGDPAQLYPLFAWDVALDNPRITTIEDQ